MKILLLTDVPPCTQFSGALVLDQLCRQLPPGSLACAAVMHSSLSHIKASPDLDMPTLYLTKPPEGAANGIRRRLRVRKLGNLAAYLFELVQAWRVRHRIVPQIVAFARAQQVTHVWAVLQGQTIIRAAMPVAQQLGVPLHTHVWDPLSWWLRANGVDRRTGNRLLMLFDEVIRASATCATASVAMSERYEKTYGVPTVPFVACMDRALLRAPATAPAEKTFTIGMAGQFYAMQEWESLLATLNQCGWNIAGRPVKIRVLSGAFTMHSSHPVHVEFMGWRSQAEAVALLAEADILYLPYWFSAEFKEEASTSFPSKLITYFAAGRPVLFHGPDYASPSIYLERHDAAQRCHGLETDTVRRALETLATDTARYATLAANGHQAFLRDFTLEEQKKALDQFLGMPQSAGEAAGNTVAKRHA